MNKIIKINIYLIILLLPLMFMRNAWALEAMSQKELKETTGQAAFADFTIIENTTRVFLDTHIETWTEVDSLKLGFHQRENTFGWDQDWANVSFGSQSNDLIIDGLIIKADFDNLDSPNPTLNRLIIGTNRINGTISGNFKSFTGAYNPALTANTNDDSSAGSSYIRKNLAQMDFNFNSSNDDNQGFFLILSPVAAQNGIHAILGYSEGNIKTDFNPNGWWDSP